MTGTRLLLGALIVAVVGTGLLSLEFRVAESASNTESSISKMTMGVAQGASYRPAGMLHVYVAPSGDVGDYLEKALVQQLKTEAGVPEVTVLRAMLHEAAGPALIVEAHPDVLRWTPVYANASFATRIAFVSDGDMSWRDDAVVKMGRPDGLPQVRLRGDLKLEDTTRGVISRPAYQRLLAQQIATSVSDALKQQVYGANW